MDFFDIKKEKIETIKSEKLVKNLYNTCYLLIDFLEEYFDEITRDLRMKFNLTKGTIYKNCMKIFNCLMQEFKRVHMLGNLMKISNE